MGGKYTGTVLSSQLCGHTLVHMLCHHLRQLPHTFQHREIVGRSSHYLGQAMVSIAQWLLGCTVVGSHLWLGELQGLRRCCPAG